MAQNNNYKSNFDDRLSEVFETLEIKRGDIAVLPWVNSDTMLTQTNENITQPLPVVGASNGLDIEPLKVGDVEGGIKLDNSTRPQLIANNDISVNEKDELDLDDIVTKIQPEAKVIPPQPVAEVPTGVATVVPAVTPATPATEVPGVTPATVVPAVTPGTVVPATTPATVVPAVTPATVVRAQPVSRSSAVGVVLGSDIKINVSENPLEGNRLTNNNNLTLKVNVLKGTGSSYSIPLEAVFPFLNNNKIQSPRDLERLLSIPGALNLQGKGFSAGNVQLVFENGKPFIKFDAVPTVATAVDLVLKGNTTSNGKVNPNAKPTFKVEANFNLTPGVGGSSNSVLTSANAVINYNNGSVDGSATITAKTVTEKPTTPTEVLISVPALYLSQEAKDKFLPVEENNINTRPQIKQR